MYLKEGGMGLKWDTQTPQKNIERFFSQVGGSAYKQGFYGTSIHGLTLLGQTANLQLPAAVKPLWY